eukprot:TRINITY_DN2098_c0_g1_i10.p1 TRINITY_DN2098_c0_g1~~TRINITY_DN2098_c0_g1_i10.p1  ORF type:complete len:477 (+),score=129.28 TRINITY_DN2098_c0_g1_i10:185-1615(+)
MDIYVDVLSDTVCVVLQEGDTVQDVKRKISSECELQPDCCSLAWEGEVLPDCAVLSEMGVANGDTLRVVLTDKMRAQMELKHMGVPVTGPALAEAIKDLQEQKARLLIQAGVGINATFVYTSIGYMTRHTVWDYIMYGRREAILLAAKLGADPNLMYDGRPPLYYMSHVEVLLSLGADPNVRITLSSGRKRNMPFISYFITELRQASSTVQTMLLAFERHKGDFNQVDSRGRTALSICCGSRRMVAVASDLLEMYNADPSIVSIAGKSPLHYAARAGHVPLIEDLVKKGVDRDVRDMYGLTPLHYASMTSHATSACVCLIRLGADVNAVCKSDGQTPAHKAAAHHCKSQLHDLFSHGADMNIRDLKGRTPLHVACEKMQWKTAMRLLSCEADPMARLPNGDNILHIAVRNRHRVLISFLRAKYGTALEGAANSMGLKPLMCVTSDDDLKVPAKTALHLTRKHTEYSRRLGRYIPPV